MPINNINTLQNYEDLRYTTYLAYQDANGVLNTDYYVHALANLEQRNEYRYSNGIKYGILRYDSSITINPNDLFGEDVTENTTFLELPNDMSFDIYVNNIETYLKHSQIYNDGNVFRSLLFGKILGSANTPETNDVEIQYTEIDLNNHSLNEAYRVFYLDDETSSNIYILIHINKEQNNGNEITYKLTVYKLVFNSENTNIKNLFRSSTYSTNNKVGSIFEDVEINVNSKELFEQLIANCSIYSTETIENNYTLDCTYDTVEEQLIKISDLSLLSDNYNKINELLYFNYYDINQYIRAINNDLAITYPNLLKYYSNRQFNSNNNTLKLMIAKALYNKIYTDLGDTAERKTAILTIPEGTTITYISNVENALQLYYTDDIYVYFINKSISNRAANSAINGITFVYDGVDKTIIYNVYSKYNTKYTELVDSLLVYKKYVLPYIDDSHLWNINDNQTSIYASGESAGNPNIFIVKTNYDSSSYSIYGHQLNRNDIQQNLLTYKTYTLPIRYNNSGTSEMKEYKYVFAIPIINRKSIDKLKYATLFAISNIVEENGNYNVNATSITTIWTIKDNSTNGEAGFEPILINGDYLTFDNMFGLDSAIYRKFAEYGHISNVFDNMIALKLPKTVLNGSEPKQSNNYFVIERNTRLDNINSDYWDENAYNYNLVEMKINDYINNPDFSYATESMYNSQDKLLNIWHNNGDETKQIYCTGSINVYKYNPDEGNQYNASFGDSYGGEQISQYVQGTYEGVTEENTYLVSVITGSFDKEDIEKYYNPDYNMSTITDLSEYLPKSYVPILKESNLFHQDNNIINRTNIYSFSNNSNIYYAYIGTSCNEEDKSTLHIGTSDFTYMVNLGKESLISSSYEDNSEIFKETTKLSVDIERTDINSQETKIKNLNVGINVRTNRYNDNLEVTTLELYHIYNQLSSQYYLLVNTIINNNEQQSLQGEDLDVNMINFDTIKMFKSTSDNKSLFVIYLKAKYPELFTNGYLDEDTSIKTLSVDEEDNNISINITGTYFNEQKLLLFDRPLIVHIVKTESETYIHI